MWYKGWRCAKETNASKNFTLKELWEIFHIDSIKDKTLEADSNLKISITINQDIEKMFLPNNFIWLEEGRHCSDYFQYIFTKK